MILMLVKLQTVVKYYLDKWFFCHQGANSGDVDVRSHVDPSLVRDEINQSLKAQVVLGIVLIYKQMPRSQIIFQKWRIANNILQIFDHVFVIFIMEYQNIYFLIYE